jgi:DNA-binding CsgD family transcriptional regulator
MVATPSETLDRIARSGEAVFAIDSADRIILWNRKCEELLQRPARAVLGKPCYEVLGGRDAQGNVYCYKNCPVAHQARQQKPNDRVQRFPLAVPVGKTTKWFTMSLFAIPSYHPALSTVVHVVRPDSGPESPLERRLAGESTTAEPLWPMTTQEGTVDLTSLEKEVLRCLSEGLSTSAIARRLFISPVTVRNHIQSILPKLGVHTKLAAVVFAYKHNLL